MTQKGTPSRLRQYGWRKMNWLHEVKKEPEPITIHKTELIEEDDGNVSL